MKEHLINPRPAKSKPFAILEYILLLICLSVIALRVSITEGPVLRIPATPMNLSDPLYSLSLSMVLTFAFIIWLLWSLCRKTFIYRITGLEIGLCVFVIAAVLSAQAASDKRLAILDTAMMLAPILAAILLVQILDTPAKIKLVLVTIAALSIVCVYQAAEQFFISNQMTIDQYEQDPQALLKPLGIEPGTLQHFLFEHRLYSRGVRGSFTTRNSAGSFLLMAFFSALGLFIYSVRAQKNKLLIIKLFTRGLIAAIIVFALILTRSKGAIIGLLFTLILLMLFLRFGRWLSIHRKAILFICILLLLAGTYAVIWYGLKYDRLPGGNSMLVRWQYWRAAAHIYTDHPFKGIGPANFAHHYTRYKPSSSPESVADPHNFPLSILTQYGPIGLVGFLAILFVPLWQAASISRQNCSTKLNQQQSLKHPTIILMLFISAVLLFIRPLFMPTTPTEDIDVLIYIVVTSYIAPTAAFVIGFYLLTVPIKASREKNHKTQNISTFTAVCFCAILAVLIHNLIDFAIFEPGVYSTFFVILACLIATHYHRTSKQLPFLYHASTPMKILVSSISIVLVAAYFNYVWWPTYKSTTNIKKAHHAISQGQFEQAHQFLSTAAKADILSPAALNLDGKIYLQQYIQSEQKQKDLLKKAEQCSLQAIERNKKDYKNYENLATLYEMLGEHQKAYEVSLKAIELYPGSGRLRFSLAQIAEKLGKTNVALVQYRSAVRIEDSFRRQFKQMYPETKGIVSRLRNDKYEFALQRIEQLSKELKKM